MTNNKKTPLPPSPVLCQNRELPGDGPPSMQSVSPEQKQSWARERRKQNPQGPPSQASCPWTAGGERREFWNPIIFYTRKPSGRFLCFVLIPFRDPRCIPAVDFARKMATWPVWQRKEEGWLAGHQLSSLRLEWHKLGGNISKRLFFNTQTPSLRQQPNMTNRKSYLHDKKELHVRRY